MRILYIIGIRIMSLIIGIASPFNHKLKQWRHGRRNIFRRIEKNVDPEGKTIWFHCASLGEFEQGRPVMGAIRDKNPDLKILLTEKLLKLKTVLANQLNVWSFDDNR